MTHYYQCQKCGKVFATWRMGETHAEKDGHSSIPLSKGAGVDQDIVITDYDNV